MHQQELRPLADRVVIRPTPEDLERASGLILPAVAAEKPQIGTVIATGPGALTDRGVRIEPEIAAGHEVLYSKYGGTEIRFNGEDLVVLKSSEILAKII